MCGRFTSTATPKALMCRFGVTMNQNLRPSWNVTPRHKAMVIVCDGVHREVISAAWGIAPSVGKKDLLINARMETASQKPTFSGVFLHSRCIVAASGWYEWSAPQKPWHIQLCDEGVIGIAGLLFRYGTQSRFVIMTSAADRALAAIHHRQPLVLGDGDEEQWLSGTADQANALCKIAPASWFKWYRVSSDVGKVGVNNPELITPLDGAALSPAQSSQDDLFN